MSELNDNIETQKDSINPFMTPLKIIEPKNKLPDYTFEQLPDFQKQILMFLPKQLEWKLQVVLTQKPLLTAQ